MKTTGGLNTHLEVWKLKQHTNIFACLFLWYIELLDQLWKVNFFPSFWHLCSPSYHLTAELNWITTQKHLHVLLLFWKHQTKRQRLISVLRWAAYKNKLYVTSEWRRGGRKGEKQKQHHILQNLNHLEVFLEKKGRLTDACKNLQITGKSTIIRAERSIKC